MLGQFDAMFNHVLAKYPYEKVTLHLRPGAKLVQCRPFLRPREFHELFCQEINNLVELKVLEPVLVSKQAFPRFLVPKKDGTARFVSNFRQLNAVLDNFTSELPLTKDVLARPSGYNWISILDLTSQFYHFVLDKESQDLCIIITPFGRYRYLRLPMGIKVAPGFAQAVMARLFCNFHYVEVFIDNVAIFTSGSFKLHLQHPEAVLHRWHQSNFSFKPKKCFTAIKEVEYLWHIITPDGVNP